MIYLTANVIILILVLAFIFTLAIHMKKPYPREVMQKFDEPYVRFFAYLILYALCFFNPLVGLFGFMGLILLHIDYINLYLK